jgi:hypothetical protein
MVLQKKTKTHKAKSAESILLQKNHPSKNIIICQKIKKKNKKQQYIYIYTVQFVYNEVQGTLDLIS